jgi:hypothetical protein
MLWVKRKATTTCLVLVLSEARGGWRYPADVLVEDQGAFNRRRNRDIRGLSGHSRALKSQVFLKL